MYLNMYYRGYIALASETRIIGYSSLRMGHQIDLGPVVPHLHARFTARLSPALANWQIDRLAEASLQPYLDYFIINHKHRIDTLPHSLFTIPNA
jgi:hypothetical protein